MSTKTILTEAQISQLDILKEAIENDNISDEQFTDILFALKESGVNVEEVLNERYGIEF
jgi:hypothetical protein